MSYCEFKFKEDAANIKLNLSRVRFKKSMLSCTIDLNEIMQRGKQQARTIAD